MTSFGDGEEFKAIAQSRAPACILLDVFLPARSGLDILKDVDAPSYAAPFIVMSGIGGLATAIEAIKNGAFDFIEKPFTRGAISERVPEVITAWTRLHTTKNNTEARLERFPGCQPLTQREADVLAELLTAGSNKQAARNLGISPRTIESHRANIMIKLGAKNTVDLVRIVMSNGRQPVPEIVSARRS